MLRRLVKKRKDLSFVVIYTREPHARQMAFKEIPQPVSWEERRALARKAKKELALEVTFLIDEMGDPSRKLFGDVPNPAILVEKSGKIRDKLSWADATEVERIVKGWGRAEPRPAKLPASRPSEKATSRPSKTPAPRPAGRGS